LKNYESVHALTRCEFEILMLILNWSRSWRSISFEEQGLQKRRHHCLYGSIGIYNLSKNHKHFTLDKQFEKKCRPTSFAILFIMIFLLSMLQCDIQYWFLSNKANLITVTIINSVFAEMQEYDTFHTSKPHSNSITLRYDYAVFLLSYLCMFYVLSYCIYILITYCSYNLHRKIFVSCKKQNKNKIGFIYVVCFF
jgi:hypothetical protein